MKGRFERLFVKVLLWGAIVAVLGLALFMTGAVWDVRQKERIAYREKEHARTVLADAEARHNTLSRDVANFENERGLEEEFRKRFPVAKEGEEVIVLVDPIAPEVEPLPPPQKTWWGTVRDWFGL